MAHLDLEEQEQIDRLKHFWQRYGQIISSAVLVILLALAGWNAYQYWQRHQATQAAALFDEVERFAREGDTSKLQRALTDIQSKFASTLYAQQAALLSAQIFVSQNQPDPAVAALKWVTEQSSDESYRSVARLRWAGLLLDIKSYDEALRVLSAPFPKSFEALAADRKGDVFSAQGQTAHAVEAYQAAYSGLSAALGEDASGGTTSEYKRLVDVKLAALGAASPGAAK